MIRQGLVIFNHLFFQAFLKQIAHEAVRLLQEVTDIPLTLEGFTRIPLVNPFMHISKRCSFKIVCCIYSMSAYMENPLIYKGIAYPVKTM